MKMLAFWTNINSEIENFVRTAVVARELLKTQSRPRFTHGHSRTNHGFEYTPTLHYRQTPCPSAPEAKSPAELFLERQIRTKLSCLPRKPSAGLLKPSAITNYNNRNRKMKEQYNRHHGVRQKSSISETPSGPGIIVPEHRNKRLVKWYNNAETGSTTFRDTNRTRRAAAVADVKVSLRNGRSRLDAANHYGRSTAPTSHRRRTPNQITTPLERLMVDPKKKTYA
ncbi:hypothetical protein V3C99_000853 [Haemonchus contortus]|uniref:Uncharacterized protein n=1 Tax=Haemonchus contortus TaxID=6289 RepID=A0A7I4YGC3_HAECO